MEFLKRTWAEINLSALKKNISNIRKLCTGKEIIAVVKANAYGHSDKIISSELVRLGIRYFAVSNLWEAEDLRRNVPDGEIIIFGYTEGKDFLRSVIENNFIHTVGSLEYARRLSSFAQASKGKIRVHIKINTGMSRAGIDTSDELDEILSLPGLKCEGAYTHFSVSDSNTQSDIDYTVKQHQLLINYASERGLLLHSQNSGGVLYHTDFKADMVRAGIIMYGYMPNAELPVSGIELNPVMTLKSTISQIKTIPKGTDIGYGRTYTAPETMQIAVVPIGYADGYSRLLSNKGAVSINGHLCSVVGRVCMDQIVVNISNSGEDEFKTGDEVEIFSASHKETSIEYIAKQLNTITYEMTCGIGRRVPRVAVRDGKVVEVIRYS